MAAPFLEGEDRPKEGCGQTGKFVGGKQEI